MLLLAADPSVLESPDEPQVAFGSSNKTDARDMRRDRQRKIISSMVVLITTAEQSRGCETSSVSVAMERSAPTTSSLSAWTRSTLLPFLFSFLRPPPRPASLPKKTIVLFFDISFLFSFFAENFRADGLESHRPRRCRSDSCFGDSIQRSPPRAVKAPAPPGGVASVETVRALPVRAGATEWVFVLVRRDNRRHTASHKVRLGRLHPLKTALAWCPTASVHAATTAACSRSCIVHAHTTADPFLRSPRRV